jgi:sigma-B regulation protein RsbU (phosphoserine phosphatase)
VGYVNGAGSAELAGRLAAMIEYGQALAAVPATRLMREAREAGKLQRDLLPADPPVIPGFSVQVVYSPAGEVSGDMYGFVQIDTDRSAVWLADVCGHGLPAAMLTGFVKQCLSDSMALSRGRRNEPEEVLHRLNRELLRQNLSGCNFAACCWAAVDHQTGRVSWARGGTPYPLVLKRGRAAVEVQSAGTVLGAIEEPALQRCSVDLEPGDSVIFHSDGLDALLRGDAPLRLDSIAYTRWFGSLRARKLEEALVEVERLRDHQRGVLEDDLCVVAVQRL